MAITIEDTKRGVDKALIFSCPKTDPQKKIFLLNFEQLKTLADSNNLDAQYLLGLSLMKGLKGCVINQQEGYKWLKRAAKKDNSPGSLCAQGLCHALGIGEIPNVKKAKLFYIQAVNQKYIPAFYHLAFLLHENEKSVKTITTASDYEIIIEQVNLEARSKIINFLTVAADAGFSPAQVQLAECFSEGWGVAKDVDQEFRLLEFAAHDGNAIARNNLGLAYASGTGVKKDISKAKEWYKLAAAQGYELAAKNLLEIPSQCCSIM